MPPKKSDRTKVTARWTNSDERVMIQFLLEEKRAGRGPNPQSGFPHSTWVSCATLLTGNEIPGTVPKDAVHCHQKYQKLKSNYKSVKELRKVSGIGWDTQRSALVGSVEVWSTIDPKLSKWSKKAFPFYEEMSILGEEHKRSASIHITPLDRQPEHKTRPLSDASDTVTCDEWVPGSFQETPDGDELKKKAKAELIGSAMPTRNVPFVPIRALRSPPNPLASGSRLKKLKIGSEPPSESLHGSLEHVGNRVSNTNSAFPPRYQPPHDQGISPLVREAMTRVEQQLEWRDEFKVQCLTLFALFPETAGGFITIQSPALAQGVLKAMINFKLSK